VTLAFLLATAIIAGTIIEIVVVVIILVRRMQQIGSITHAFR
jgi:hypothetical protein